MAHRNLLESNLKGAFRKLLLRLGVWYPSNLARRFPEILSWLTSGCSGVAPHPVKMMIISSYLKNWALDNFLETGTYLGETLGYVARSGVSCTSIELSPELYAKAQIRFRSVRNVQLIHGDSGEQLPVVLHTTASPTLFWLDGHYSAGITALSQASTPIGSELEAILRHPVKRHVILIDDARCFNGEDGYPFLDDLLCRVREDGNYSAEVSADIIRLTPKRKDAP